MSQSNHPGALIEICSFAAIYSNDLVVAYLSKASLISCSLSLTRFTLLYPMIYTFKYPLNKFLLDFFLCHASNIKVSFVTDAAILQVKRHMFCLFTHLVHSFALSSYCSLTYLFYCCKDWVYLLWNYRVTKCYQSTFVQSTGKPIIHSTNAGFGYRPM